MTTLPLVASVPHFPNLTEDDPRKGFLKPELYRKLLFEFPEDLRLLFVIAYHVGFLLGSNPIKNFQASWNLACQPAGIPDLLSRDLRRTAVRNLRRAGVLDMVIMKISGHRTRCVFERYNVLITRTRGKRAERRKSSEIVNTKSTWYKPRHTD